MIGVVVVTYNRLDMLKIALDKYDQQFLLPDYIIVVNNASTDGTDNYLQKWKIEDSKYERVVINNETNVGGSGGFYIGLEKAMSYDTEWIWISDDDAFPENDALLNAQQFLEKHKESSISAICAEVLNNNRIDLCHRSNTIVRGIRVKKVLIEEKTYREEAFELNCFSYVGTIINRDKLFEVGLPLKDYFICYDDTEHSLRLSKVGKIYCVPSIKVHHNVKPETTSLNWKTYYYYRNNINMIKRHFPKYCYLYEIVRFWIASIIKWFLPKEKIKTKLFQMAVKDAITENLGKHSLYKPGWNPNEIS